MSSHVSRGQSLKCKLQRALGDLSFICMTVFRIMNFILNVSQLAELSRSPLALLFLSSHCPCRRTLIQTQPLPYTVLMLHTVPFSLLYLSITVSLTHTWIHSSFLSPSSFSVRHLRVLCLVPLALTLAAVTSQRKLTLEPHRKVDCVNCKRLSLSHPICLFYPCDS